MGMPSLQGKPTACFVFAKIDKRKLVKTGGGVLLFRFCSKLLHNIEKKLKQNIGSCCFIHIVQDVFNLYSIDLTKINIYKIQGEVILCFPEFGTFIISGLIYIIIASPMRLTLPQ